MPNGLPSGEQIEIRAGEQHVVVVEVGAALRSYKLGRRALLDGYAAEEMAGVGRGQVLIPWPNRVEDGAYEFAGVQHQLPLDEPAAQNAIHGLVRWAAWSTAEREADRVTLAYTLHPQPGYPFSLALSIEYALSDEGLRVTTSATNVGPGACPYGSGQHPYLTLGTEKVDTLYLRAPGRTVLQADDRGIPVSAMPVEGTVYDFRAPKPIGRRSLTTPSPISSVTTTGSRTSSFGHRTAETRSRSGSGRAIGICSSSPVIPYPTSTGEASPWSR
jgi:aldose 1-epimerase